jgi:hypothetical protein
MRSRRSASVWRGKDESSPQVRRAAPWVRPFAEHLLSPLLASEATTPLHAPSEATVASVVYPSAEAQRHVPSMCHVGRRRRMKDALSASPHRRAMTSSCLSYCEAYHAKGSQRHLLMFRRNVGFVLSKSACPSGRNLRLAGE